MTKLAELFLQEVSEGRFPSWGSDEGRAYLEYREAEQERENLINQTVKESALRVYGSQYYLLGSMI
jgi:hypothetical protein